LYDLKPNIFEKLHIFHSGSIILSESDENETVEDFLKLKIVVKINIFNVEK